MPSPYFKVKALYDYSSEYDDDLNFSEGTVITVTNIEDAEWYSGTYTNPATGEVFSGIFPQNFVERFEEPAGQLKEERIANDSQPAISEAQESSKIDNTEHNASTIVPQSISENKEDKKSEKEPIVIDKVKSNDAVGVQQQHSGSSDSGKAVSTTAAHKNKLFNKIAAFNSPEAAPILPTGNTLDEKANKRQSFVGVPSSYVPPSFGFKKANTFDSVSSNEFKSIGDDEPVKESHASFEQEESEEQAQPKLSLKERIALLQKRQQEEAEREAALIRKKAEKKKLRKNPVETANSTISRTSTHSENGLNPALNESITQDSASKEHAANDMKELEDESSNLPSSESINKNNTNVLIQENDENLEDVKVVKDENEINHNMNEQQREDKEEVVEEEDNEDADDDDEDDEDDEEMRKRELRERMAKLSGGAGMFGMMGMSPFGNALPKHKKKTKSSNEVKSKPQEEEDNDFVNMPKAVPILPISGNQALPKNLENMVSSVDTLGESTSGASEINDNIDIDSFNRDIEKDSKDAQVHTKELNQSINVGYSEEDDEVEELINEQNLGAESESQEDLEFIDADEEKLQHVEKVETFTKKDKQTFLDSTQCLENRHILSEDTTSSHEEEEEEEEEKGIQKSSPIVREKPEQIVKDTFVHSAPPLPPQSAAPSLPTKETIAPLKQSTSFNLETNDLSSDEFNPSIQHEMPPALPPALPTSNAPSSEKISVPEIPRTIAPAIPVQEVHSSPAQSAPPGPPINTAPAIPMQHPQSLKKSAPPEPPHNAAPMIPKQDNQFTAKSIAPEPPHSSAPELPSDDVPNFEGYNMTVATESEGRGNHHHHGQHHHQGSSGNTEIQEPHTSESYQAIPVLRASSKVTDYVVHVDENKDWYVNNQLPPSLQDQVGKTLIYEVEERKPNTRSNLDIIEKDFYILMIEQGKYLQKLVSVRYEENNTDNSSFHIADIPVLDEEPSSKYGLELYSLAVKYSGHSIDPSLDFVTKLFGKIPSILPSIGLISFGKLLYVNESHSITNPYSSFQPGDIISIFNARFTGHNKLRQKITYDVGVNRPMVAVISEFDPVKQKFRVLEKDSKSKIKPVSYKISDMQAGTIKVFRPLGRDYVGW